MKKKDKQKTSSRNHSESRLLMKAFLLGNAKPGETAQFIIGLIITFVAVFMILSFSSYISTGYKDQGMLEAESLTTGIDIRTQNIDTHKSGNIMGYMGAKTAYFFLHRCYGFSSFFIPVFFIFLGLRLMKAYRVNLWRIFINLAFLMIWLSVALAFFIQENLRQGLFFPPGGEHGEYICRYFNSLIGVPGLFMLLVVSAICYLTYLCRRTVIVIRKTINGEYAASAKKSLAGMLHIKEDLAENSNEETPPTEEEIPGKGNSNAFEYNIPTPENISTNRHDEGDIAPEDTKTRPTPDFEISKGEDVERAKSKTVGEERYDPTKDLSAYKYPTLDLLKKYPNSNHIDITEQNTNKSRITTILHTFGVEISSIKATVGPTITLYEITPAPGIKISKIRGLEDDIALSLSATGIRIIAPIPGKGTIGIEVPNEHPQIVSTENILNSKKFQETKFDLPIAFGRTITNDIYMVDLAKMPHLLVAGATGTGKSVGLNIIIASLLYKKHPNEMKLVLIDPKKVEFSIYAPLDKFFMARVDDGSDNVIITDVTQVKKTLNSLCKEMDDRYMLLKQAKVRNIKEYNEKFKNRLLSPENGHRFLPYIVVIIDEFCDLIMVAGKEVEFPMSRIAQLARAVGIHMIIATQRPDAKIITGPIRSNVPARVAFKVNNSMESRIILDRTGANQLIGKGDMLFFAGGSSPERIQCAFISTEEVDAITQFIASQKVYPTPYLLPDVAEENGEVSGNGNISGGELDSMFDEVARFVVSSQTGSTSFIQRKFSIGYNRAGRLMDQLENKGIIGPQQGSKPREVYIQDPMELERILEQLK